jgi:Spy/CpxP family protein refolding chaperone
MNALSLRQAARSLSCLGLATALIFGAGTTATMTLATAVPALAQDQPSGAAPANGRGNRMGKMLMSLNLSDAQKTQIRAIIADARKQNQNVTDREQRRATMKAAYAKVETVLTPAQRTELHAKMEAMHQQDSSAHTQ